MKKVLLGSVATGALALAGVMSGAFTADSANAADLRMPLKAPPPPAPVFSWSGCYVGAHWGWGWGKKSGQGLSFGSFTSFGSFSNTVSGPIFGGQLGCNYQWPGSNFVIGIEGSYSAADINGEGASFFSTEGHVRNKIDSLASITGRLGWNGWDPMVLFYVKGGWAWAHQRDWFRIETDEDIFTKSSTNGWTIGGGIEMALSFAPKWSVFAEYMHYDFRRKDVGPLDTNDTIVFSRTKLRVDTVRVGINYRLFSPF